jgi:hypothetical protein
MREQDVPSITMDPSSGSAGITPGQMPPSADPTSMAVVTAAALGQVPPIAGKTASPSTLGAAPATKPLKKKKLGVKKFAL